MAYIQNDEKNVKIELNLIKTKLLDVVVGRDNFENWIPFEMSVMIENEFYYYSKEMNATLTLEELYRLVDSLDKIIQIKEQKKQFEQYVFIPVECYFELVIYDTLEDYEIYMDLWLKMGFLTDEEIHGFDKGFRFTVELDILIQFKNDLNNQLREILRKNH